MERRCMCPSKNDGLEEGEGVTSVTQFHDGQVRNSKTNKERTKDTSFHRS